MRSWNTIGWALGCAFAGGAIMLLLREHMVTAKLREHNHILRQQLAQGAELSRQNFRLSNLVAVASRESALPEEQFRELLRLRGEVGRLRNEKREQGSAQAIQGRAANSSASGAELPAESQAPERFTTESLAFAGYTQPRAALQSHLWASLNAARNRDGKAILDSLTPEERARWLAVHKSEDAVAAQVAKNWSGITGFRVLKEQPISAEEVWFTVHVEGLGLGARMALKRVGTEWKFDRQLGLR